MKYNFCWLQARRAHGIDLSNTIILLDEAHNIVRLIFCQIQPDILLAVLFVKHWNAPNNL